MTRLVATLRHFPLLMTIALLAGCASLVSSATARMANNISAAIVNQNDPETVRDGAPAYLLFVDGLIADNPDNLSLLLAGTKLYSAYASVFVTDLERVRRMTDKALDYGGRALCRQNAAGCGLRQLDHDTFGRVLATLQQRDVAALYALGSAWAGWIEARNQDWKAIADLPKVQATMRRVVALDERFERGAAHIYLGVLETLRPAALGGKPDEGRRHFERAISLSDGRNLMAKVQYARRYARLVFDRDLHDRLIGEVLAADPREPGLTLLNTLAQRQARELRADADKYF